MKKYLAFISASCVSRLPTAFHHFALFFATTLSWLAILTSVGCQTPGQMYPLTFHSDVDRSSLQTSPRVNVAKPATQEWGQQTAYSNYQSNGRNVPVQQATYQYPATNPPSQRPAFIGSPQSSFRPQQSTQPFGQQQFPSGQFQGQPATTPGQQIFQTPQQGQPVFQAPQPNFQSQQFQNQQFQNQQLQIQPNFQSQQFQNQPGFQTGQPFQAPNNLPITQPEMLDIDVFVPQTTSGRFSIGGTYGTNNGLLGQFIFEENDFDLFNPPRSLRDAFTNPGAFRGGGQRLRLEAVPGTDVQRYLVSFADPYFRNTQSSLSVNAYLFDREYFEYDENRLGGKVKLGRRLTPYLSVEAGLTLERVRVENPRLGTSPQLNDVLGDNSFFQGSVGLVYDNRVFPYLTGVGTYLSLKFSQAFGDFTYSRGEVDYRNHQTIFARPDGSGRHTIGLSSKLGFTGSDTPVYENFFGGGISSLRGFAFRGVSPVEGGVRVGGEFQWLNSLEYNFPLTEDDMIAGALFVDFGTIEESVELNSENFRVAPGLGLRVHLPYAGLGGPLSFDFAFPVSTAEGDEENQFSFFVGVVR